ncbi:MAG: hypothetical protein ABL882_00665 [Sphingopyxis sp.]
MALVAAVSFPASAQTQQQQDRVNRVAQFVVTAPMCEFLGMHLDPELPAKAEAAFRVETASWQIDLATIERLQVEAISRQGAIMGIDLEAASSRARTEAQLRGVRTILLGYGRTCIAATADSIFAPLITLPTGYDLETAVTDTADTVLEAGGLASWQTSQIQARGDLMFLAGDCRSIIGAERSDALVREFGQSDDPRVLNYYSRSFDEGLADPTIVSTLAGCNRAIAANRVQAQALRQAE